MPTDASSSSVATAFDASAWAETVRSSSIELAICLPISSMLEAPSRAASATAVDLLEPLGRRRSDVTDALFHDGLSALDGIVEGCRQITQLVALLALHPTLLEMGVETALLEVDAELPQTLDLIDQGAQFAVRTQIGKLRAQIAVGGTFDCCGKLGDRICCQPETARMARLLTPTTHDIYEPGRPSKPHDRDIVVQASELAASWRGIMGIDD